MGRRKYKYDQNQRFLYNRDFVAHDSDDERNCDNMYDGLETAEDCLNGNASEVNESLNESENSSDSIDSEDWIDSEDEEDSFIILDDDVQPNSYQCYSVADNYDNCSDISKKLRQLSEKNFLEVSASLLARDTKADFVRRTATLDREDRRKCLEIHVKTTENFEEMYICNNCLNVYRTKVKFCCSVDTVRYTRVPLNDQLTDIIHANFDDLIEIRENVKKGLLTGHNTIGSKFQDVIKESDATNFKLSVISSLDGVRINGHTSAEIWPVTAIFPDLSTERVNLITNVLLIAVLECNTKISTDVWSYVYENFIRELACYEVKCRGTIFTFKIISIVADQPAKRTLYGFKGHSSSCSYRESERGENGTMDDWEHGNFGYATFKSIISIHVKPYDTVLDLLHDSAEGFLFVVVKESDPLEDKRKSDVFLCDQSVVSNVKQAMHIPDKYRNNSIQKFRNGTSKSDHFRTVLMTVSIIDDSMSALGRFIVVGLGLIVNNLHTSNDIGFLYLKQISNILDMLINTEHKDYSAIKCHELIQHLPENVQKFGNVGVLSTTCFETAYKVIFGDFHTSSTTNFAVFASGRFIVNMAMRREFERRWKIGMQSEPFKRFASVSKNLIPNEIKVSGKLSNIESVDTVKSCQQLTYYGILKMRLGKFVSVYKNVDTKCDVLFYKNGSEMCIGRFIAVVVNPTKSRILVEHFQNIDKDKQFCKLRLALAKLKPCYVTPCEILLKMLINSNGHAHACLTGARRLVDFKQVQGSACYMKLDKTFIIFQLNGANLHS